MRPYKQLEFKCLLLGLALLAVFSLLPSQCWASACCARSSAAPTLILGEDQAQLSLGVSFGSVVAQADEEGAAIFGSPQVSNTLQTYRLDVATLISDRFQVGGSFSLVQQSVTQIAASGSSWGMGDSRLSFAYEFLPLWVYSNWKPQGFLFSVITLPTGRSRYETQNTTASDVVGNGFYSVSFGSIFIKRWNVWDMFIMPEFHYSFPRTFQISERSFQVVPGLGGSLGLGGGVSPGGGNFRLGVRFQPRVDQARSVPSMDRKGGVNSMMANSDFGIDLSYLLSTNDTVMFFYTDQTLLGPAMNSNLSRIVGVNFQHRWER